jgi:hypothetical protein
MQPYLIGGTRGTMEAIEERKWAELVAADLPEGPLAKLDKRAQQQLTVIITLAEKVCQRTLSIV